MAYHRTLVAALALVSLSACTQETPPPVQQLQTADGLPFVLLAMPGADEVAIQAAWATDWFFHPDENPAAAYVGANLVLAGGAEGWSSGEAAERFADLRAQANLSVMADHVFGITVMPKAEAQDVAGIVNAHLVAPALDADWFARLRDQFRDQMSEINAQPETAVFEAFRVAVLRDHPVNEALTLRDPGVVSALTVDDVRAWHAQTFTRARLTLAVAGDLTPAEAQELVETLSRGMPEGSALTVPDLPTDYAPRRIVLHDPALTEGIVAALLPLPPLAEGGEMDDIAIAQALGQGDQSALFTALRTEARAAYGVEVGANGFTRATRFMLIFARVDPARVQESLDTILTTYDGFREAGAIAGLDAMKEGYLTFGRGFAERPENVASAAVMALLDGHDPALARDNSPLVAALTPTSVAQRLSQVYPRSGDLLVIVGAPAVDAISGACVIAAPLQAMGCQ